MKDNYFKGFLVGAAIGAVAGLLLAPQSGEKTREDIKKLALNAKDKAQDKYLQARKKVETNYLKLRKLERR
jgi:gas vesicle protein